jgi:hypothetical protein
MAAKEETTETTESSSASSGSTSASSSGTRSRAKADSTQDDQGDQGDPTPGRDAVTMIGMEKVTTAPDPKSADTFHKPVVMMSEFAQPGDPANAVVRVTKDVVVDRAEEGQRPQRVQVAAAGTLTTRRLAEEQGIKDIEEVKQ